MLKILGQRIRKCFVLCYVSSMLYIVSSIWMKDSWKYTVHFLQILVLNERKLHDETRNDHERGIQRSNWTAVMGVDMHVILKLKVKVYISKNLRIEAWDVIV